MDYILNRRSVRKFDLNKKISFLQLKELCKYAESAPSARRQVSREYVIVDDQNIIDELSKVSKGSMILSECNTLIAIIGKDPTTISTPLMQPQDLSAATENILLAATMMGYGSCWIGIYPLEDRMQSAGKILNLKDNKFVFSLVALGFPAQKDCFYDAKKLNEENIYHNGY